MNKNFKNKYLSVIPTAVFVVACEPAAETGPVVEAASVPVRMIPTFEADPDWPQVPDQWLLGDVSSIAIDADDNAWLLHRPKVLEGEELERAAPPVIGFDSGGNYLAAWGGPGEGFDWPQREHGLSIDHEGYFWLGGNYCPARNLPGHEPVYDDALLKFTRDGEFVMQIGRASGSTGNADTENVHEPADSQVHAPTNEVFVADGYGNHRVAVFDATTGEFKRLWGAFGNEPEDKDDCPNIALSEVPPGPGPDQLSVVHALRVSSDGLVYVADRENRRIQIFTLEGEYIDQIIWHDERFARNVALSHDADQQFLYVGGGSGIFVYDRESLDLLTRIEDEYVVSSGHHIETDAQGNLYIAATGAGYQRLLFTGLIEAE